MTFKIGFKVRVIWKAVNYKRLSVKKKRVWQYD